MLERIARCMTPAAREQALSDYIEARALRRKYARTRDGRDKDRRTLVGAHVSRTEAQAIAEMAANHDMSVTAYVRHALRVAGQDTHLRSANGHLRGADAPIRPSSAVER